MELVALASRQAYRSSSARLFARTSFGNLLDTQAWQNIAGNCTTVSPLGSVTTSCKQRSEQPAIFLGCLAVRVFLSLDIDALSTGTFLTVAVKAA